MDFHRIREFCGVFLIEIEIGGEWTAIDIALSGEAAQRIIDRAEVNADAWSTEL